MQSTSQRLTRGLGGALASIALFSVMQAGTRSAQAQGVSPTGYYTYTLNNVAFDTLGTGTVSGYFDFDPTTGQFGAFDIATSPGTYYDGVADPGYDFNSVAGSAAVLDPYDISFAADSFFLNQLSFQFGAPLGTSGTDDVTASLEFSNPLDDLRTGASGTVVVTPAASAVPELSPAAAVGLMSILGAGALGLAKRKRRSHPDGLTEA